MTRINKNMTEIIYKKLSYKVNGAAFETQNTLGRYRGHGQYVDKLESALLKNGLKCSREVPLAPSFQAEKKNRNIPDLVVEGEEGRLVIEVKAKRILTKKDYFQLQRYLASGNFRLGILLNFRQYCLKPKRIINSEYKR
ncbi:hypothetical protein A2482_01350 [Candidatus Falkowbacteria bacterium RIFOXYC2_FULL_48_21]|uniref:GxxExxY protein n=1 Tax=Candidatus Falkowbacteria bacterium RIFOXYC2_FULL_48_21 TaxID=1798005 RepID=A0A1F5THV4_9BACT|nr:MAG: hypothetical protein A2482_01350 [Candidatus Falkowbacteria bacterium RIFOXYC2_FULL_48_21]